MSAILGHAPARPERTHTPGLWVKLIASFKLLGALLLIIAGIGVVTLVKPSAALEVSRWISILSSNQARLFLQRVWSLAPEQAALLSAGSFVYAALLSAEGLGLLLGKRWAEYLTVLVTASLLPLEIYELAHEVTPLKLLIFASNLLILGYLIVRLWRSRKATR